MKKLPQFDVINNRTDKVTIKLDKRYYKSDQLCIIAALFRCRNLQ